MKNKLNRKVLGLILLLGFIFLFAAPVWAADGIVPCGHDGKACTLCDLIKGFKILFDYGIKIIAVITLACATFAGVMYIVSSGNEGTMESAKKFLSASLIGFAVVLGAWVMVNTTIKVLMPTKTATDAEGFLGTGKTSWVDFGSVDCSSSTATNGGLQFNNFSGDNSETPSLAGATAGESYTSESFTVNGADGPIDWSIDGQPAGLDIKSTSDTTGVISGTPTTAGTYMMTVTATDTGANGVSVNNPANIFFGAPTVFAAKGDSVSMQVELIVEGLGIITASPLPNGTAYVPYTTYIYGSGGNSGYSWSLKEGYELPPGLSLKNTSYNFVEISGTPTQAGAYTIGIKLNSGTEVSKEFSLVIAEALTSVIISTTSLYGGEVSVPYGSAIEASVVGGDYSWSATGLPPGLNFAGCLAPICRNHAKLTGTPTAAGTYTVKVTVTAGGKSADQSFELIIMPSGTGDFFIATTSLPSGKINVPYSTNIYGSGGSGGYSWSLGGGHNLPSGLSFANNTSGYATITGTPTAAGTYGVNIKLTSAGKSISQDFSLVIKGVDVPIDPPINPPIEPPINKGETLAMTPDSSLPDATVGVPYSTNIYGSGGSCPYTWRSYGANYSADCRFPSGISFKGFEQMGYSKYATVYGTPTQAGTYDALCIYLASGWPAVTKKLTLVVKPANANDLVLSSAFLHWGFVGTNYNKTLSATGGDGTYTWSATGFPPGCYIDKSSGNVYGAPTKEGTYNAMITVTSGGQSVTKEFEWTVRP